MQKATYDKRKKAAYMWIQYSPTMAEWTALPQQFECKLKVQPSIWKHCRYGRMLRETSVELLESNPVSVTSCCGQTRPQQAAESTASVEVSAVSAAPLWQLELSTSDETIMTLSLWKAQAPFM